MPTNPHDLKTKVVDEGLKNAGLNPETDEIDAMQAIGAVSYTHLTLPKKILGSELGAQYPITDLNSA